MHGCGREIFGIFPPKSFKFPLRGNTSHGKDISQAKNRGIGKENFICASAFRLKGRFCVNFVCLQIERSHPK